MPKVYLVRSTRISFTEWFVLDAEKTAYLGKIRRQWGEGFPSTVDIGGVAHSTELIGIVGDLQGKQFCGGRSELVEIDYVDNEGGHRCELYINKSVC